MKRRKYQTAARYRAAVFLLVLGCLLPSIAPHGKMEVPKEVRVLLKWTLREEKDPARCSFVYAACSLTNQVGYFWGGKGLGMAPAGDCVGK